MTTFPGREYQTGADPDQEWAFYRGVLLPDDRQRHCIEDYKVLGALEANGDGLRQPREIDHWIDFPDADSRREFEKRAHGLGFQTRGLLDPDEENADFGIQLWREDVPSYGAIEPVTLALYDLALETGGEYDGWETYVVEG